MAQQHDVYGLHVHGHSRVRHSRIHHSRVHHSRVHHTRSRHSRVRHARSRHSRVRREKGHVLCAQLREYQLHNGPRHVHLHGGTRGCEQLHLLRDAQLLVRPRRLHGDQDGVRHGGRHNIRHGDRILNYVRRSDVHHN